MRRISRRFPPCEHLTLGWDGETPFHTCNSAPCTPRYKYAPDAGEKRSAFSQDAVRAKQNLIRDNFKDQFLMSIKTSVNYLL